MMKNGARDRGSRFLSLFTVVRFPNEMCLTTTHNNGTCYTPQDCEAKGGTPQGPCASGFGVCCYFQYICSSNTMENGTYWVNPATPQSMCHLMITRMNTDICQIRLELDVFEIAGPNEKGECADEFFLVTGGSPVPPICGVNNKQHLIYSVTPDSGPSQLSVILSVSSTQSSNARLWNIRIYQYECTSPVLAPVGCLQHFMGASGMVMSFNYMEEIGTPANTDGVNHLANMNYAACVRMESGYCGIRWAQYPNDMVSFTLSGDASDLTSTSPKDVKSVVYGDDTKSGCPYDYVRIPGGSEDGNTHTSRERYCGQALGFCRVQTGKTVDCAAALGAIITYAKPFVLGVVTDGDEGGKGTANNAPEDKANRGFKLIYNQQPCMAG